MSDAERIFTQHARSFAPATRLLPRADRERIARLYAICRTLDDLADRDGSRAAAQRLARIEAELRGTTVVTDPLVVEADKLFAGDSQSRATLADLTARVLQDTTGVQIKDDTELLDYAWHVAGTVGLLFCDLYGIRAAEARARAASLGIAMQLTNIVRDVGEDARAGRRYLPATWLPASPAELVDASPAGRAEVRAAIHRTLALAERHYSHGLSGLSVLPLRVRVTVMVAAALYRAIGRQLGGRGDLALDRRVHVPLGTKVVVACRALISLFRPAGAVTAEYPHAGSRPGHINSRRRLRRP